MFLNAVNRSTLTRRFSGALLVVMAVALMATVPAPRAAEATTAWDAVIDITFPVAGPVRYTDDYDARRSGGRFHRATDILAPEGARVHAAVGGTVSFVTGLNGMPPDYGYMISIAGDDGRTYRYIHLGRQDLGPDRAYAPGLSQGLRIERGQWIGYNGCSGNASCSVPHLHFEILADVNEPVEYLPLGEDNPQTRMNPYRSLRAAQDRGDLPSGAGLPSRCTGVAYAFAGDWDGSRRDGQGWWCDGRVRLRTSTGMIHEFNYGRAGDVPVVADWNGNGRETVSIIRDGRWHLNNNLGGGAADRIFTYGRVSQGDLPIAGAWDGRGLSLPGVIRDTTWHLRDSHSGGPSTWQFRYGRLSDGDKPLWGDWNGDGHHTPGIVRTGRWHLRNSLSGGNADLSFTYGRVLDGDLPVVGDWNGDGRHSPAIVRGDHWHLRYVNQGGAADITLSLPRP